MEREGFDELRRHWNRFLRRSVGADRAANDADDAGSDELWMEELRVRTRRHVAVPLGGVGRLIGISLVIGLVGAVVYVRLVGVPQSSPDWRGVRWVMIGGLAIAIAFLTSQIASGWHRRVRVPMERLLADRVGDALTIRDYRGRAERGDRFRRFEQRRRTIGVTDRWDRADDVTVYERCVDGGYESVEVTPPGRQIHDALVAVLGRKDETTRRFVPGKFSRSLIDGKRSINAFLRRHGGQVRESRDGRLSPDDGVRLIESLASSAVRPGSPAATFLDELSRRGRQGQWVRPNQWTAEVWRRDPWRDLTSQTDFYSSASLRGVRRIGRGTKGRLSPFLYLDDPAMSCLDIGRAGSRLVRVRMMLVTIGDASGKAAGEVAVFIDGIEGTNSVPTTLVRRVVVDHVRRCGIAWLVVNSRPLNQTPRYYADAFRSMGPLRTVVIESLDLPSDRQAAEPSYLDAIGIPIEPWEYAVPEGRVIGTVVRIGTHDRPMIGRRPTPVDRGLAWWRGNALNVAVGSAIGFAAVSVATSAPWMLPPLVLAASVALAIDHRYRRWSVRSKTAA